MFDGITIEHVIWTFSFMHFYLQCWAKKKLTQLSGDEAEKGIGEDGIYFISRDETSTNWMEGRAKRQRTSTTRQEKPKHYQRKRRTKKGNIWDFYAFLLRLGLPLNKTSTWFRMLRFSSSFMLLFFVGFHCCGWSFADLSERNSSMWRLVCEWSLGEHW